MSEEKIDLRCKVCGHIRKAATSPHEPGVIVVICDECCRRAYEARVKAWHSIGDGDWDC